MTTKISGDTGVSQCQPNSVSQDDLQGGVVGKGPAFNASADGSQTLVSGGVNKILLQTENFDTNNCFASSRFTPTVAGYYQINFTLVTESLTSTRLLSTLHVNGIERSRGGDTGLAVSGGIVFASAGSILQYMNGTTDYVELFGYCEPTNILVGAVTSLSGALVRAAP